MADDDTRVLAGVELGGTKSIAIVARGRDVLDRVSVPTTTPAATIAALANRLAVWSGEYRPRALGIASFGPVSIRREANDYGRMLPTPKPGWAGADILGPLETAIRAPAVIHTDVTAAALAERDHGAASGLDDFIYVTIGTGVGMGIIAGGRPVAGMMHPEAGHVRVPRLAGDGFPGVCPFHGDCLEGLAAGPAIAARAGRPAETLAPDDPAWIATADAIAQAFAGLLLTLSSAAIVVGGGVGVGQPHLLGMIRPRIVDSLGGYLPHVDARSIERIVVPAALGGEAGPLGTLVLARTALG